MVSARSGRSNFAARSLILEMSTECNEICNKISTLGEVMLSRANTLGTQKFRVRVLELGFCCA